VYALSAATVARTMGSAMSALPVQVSATALSASPDAQQLPALQSAAAVALDSDELLLFGGGAAAQADEAAQFNDVWLLKLSSDSPSWRRVETSGAAPCARTGHALAALAGSAGSLVVVVGGCSATLGHLADVHVLDTATWTWSQPTGLAGAFTARDKLSAVVQGARVFLFGGFGPASLTSEGVEEEEEEQEEGVSFEWHNDTLLLERLQGGEWVCSNIATAGEVPSPRAAHAAALLGSRMYIFGGRESGGRSADTYSLHLDERSWRREAAAGPVARAQHSMAAMPGVAGAVCFGGLSAEGTVLDSLEILDARVVGNVRWWSVTERCGSWPGPRCGAASAVIGTKLVLLGGANAEGLPAEDAVVELGPLQAALINAVMPPV